jgi:16S rRNA (cytidine1402-2'-O)-methyltransferase
VSLIPQIPLKSGLYVVSVPIGNLQDITLRALDTLKKLDKIYCEDTRVTRKLLGLYQITPPTLIRCDDISQESAIQDIKNDIQNGLAVGLVSDAGTPLISDPGYVILTALRKENMPIYPIAGVCAAIAALSVSGLPTFTFQFMGFVPKKQKSRLEIIDTLLHNPNTYIFYERPERIIDFLTEFPDTMQTVDCFIAREITKIHEEYIYGTLNRVKKTLETMSQKGEAVLIIATHNLSLEIKIDIETEIITLLNQGKTLRDISHNPYLLKHFSRNDLYHMAQKIKNETK